MAYCLYEFAKHPEIQLKVQQEIDRVLKSAKSEGVTYEMLNDLKYLECCIDEALRKYPIVPILFRQCVEDYKMPDSDVTILKGQVVFIPVLGLQRDPEIFENPLEYKPERFQNSSHGGNENAKGLFYLPFGDGPRNCIGMRLGKLTAKLGLVTVLSKYSVDFADKTMADKELDFDPRQFVLMPTQKFNFKVTERKL